MSERVKFTVGQWVCALQNGALVYGVIRYIKPGVYPRETYYVTDCGAFTESQIQEAR